MKEKRCFFSYEKCLLCRTRSHICVRLSSPRDESCYNGGRLFNESQRGRIVSIPKLQSNVQSLQLFLTPTRQRRYKTLPIKAISCILLPLPGEQRPKLSTALYKRACRVGSASNTRSRVALQCVYVAITCVCHHRAAREKNYKAGDKDLESGDGEWKREQGEGNARGKRREK